MKMIKFASTSCMNKQRFVYLHHNPSGSIGAASSLLEHTSLVSNIDIHQWFFFRNFCLLGSLCHWHIYVLMMYQLDSGAMFAVTV